MKTNVIKQLSSFMVMNVNGGDRISFTYDEINEATGEVESQSNKQSFFVTDQKAAEAITAIRQFIREQKLS